MELRWAPLNFSLFPTHFTLQTVELKDQPELPVLLAQQVQLELQVLMELLVLQEQLQLCRVLLEIQAHKELPVRKELRVQLVLILLYPVLQEVLDQLVLMELLVPQEQLQLFPDQQEVSDQLAQMELPDLLVPHQRLLALQVLQVQMVLMV
jgi:hypothetical protein